MAKGDFVEILVDAGGGTAREYRIGAMRAGRRLEIKTSRTSVEVNELTRNGRVVRSARFMAPRVLALVEHRDHIGMGEPGGDPDLPEEPLGLIGPRPGVRAATVVVGFKGGWVVAGRSLRLVEEREDLVGRLAIAGWLAALVATAVAGLAAELVARKLEDSQSRQ